MYTQKTGVPVKMVTAAFGTYSQTLNAEMGKSEAPTLFVMGNQAGVRDWTDYTLDLKGTAIEAELNTDAYNLYAFWFTALYAVVSLVLINVLAFTVAYALTQGIKGSNLFRTVFFMPNLIGGIVLGHIWSMIFDGILSRWSTSILMDSRFGFWGLIILMCWQQIGYMMIIYIAGLQAVPEDMIEAARIDGATKSQTLFKVTIPNVMPSITICMFLSLTNGFKLFDQNLALTAGQPIVTQPGGTAVKMTEMLALNIYTTYYNSNPNAHGTAQAKAVIFFILVAGLGLAQLAYTRKKEVQQ